MQKFNIKGSIVALVTPMQAGGEVDTSAFNALLDWHLTMQTQAVVVAGTTGESPTLTISENQQLIAQAVKWSNGRMPIIGGVGANSTAEAIALTRQAAADGADAGLSVIPYYNRPPQEGLFRHFSAIADAADIPIILYDVPKRCGVTFATDTLIRLAAHPRIVGIKDATGDLSHVTEYRRALPENFLLYSGNDDTAANYILAGGDGVISVTANIAPQQMQRMAMAAVAGDETTARRLDAPLQFFHAAQSAESSPIPVKWALADEGRINSAIRLPLTPLASQHHPTVRDAVARSKQESV